MSETRQAGVHIVGREAELAALEAFVDGGASTLVLVGGPGLGKTTLWEAGVELARERGVRVLSARGSGAETRLSFAGLVDLFDGVGTDELAGLPLPQRRALEVALFRAEPTGAAPEPHAIALGVLQALRSLAAAEPLLIALDDVRWLDTASDDALAFAARRLGDAPIAFLRACRPGRLTELQRVLKERPLERRDVQPLSFGATRRLLAERLELTSLPRHTLRRVFETTLGNPLFVLEVGRTMAAG